MMFERLPKPEQKIHILEIIPKRFINAEIEDLTKPMQKTLIADNDTGVFLWGMAGVGKTYALAALAKKYITEGFIVNRIHYEVLCLRLRDTFKSKAKQTEWDIFQPLLECDKLFIEDVGTSKDIGKQETEFSLRTFYVLIDMRLENCRPTFITSNKSLENLARGFDDRIGDRLRTYKVLKLSGKSRRK
jgi:DNA replication protein DnaC